MSGVGEDMRFRTVLTAASRERSNRPRGLVAAAGALLVVAAIVAALGVGARARAAAGLRAEARRQVQVEARVAALESLRAAQEETGAPTGEPIGLMELAQRLGDIAQQAGLKDRPPMPRELPSLTQGKILVKKYAYQNVRNTELAPMLEWLTRATHEVPGLEVYGLELAPDASGWTMSTITLRRWERAP